MSEQELLKVGELARICRKTVRALRLYEEMGLLCPSERSKGGFRLYPQEAIERVRWISKLQDMRLSLTEIKTLMDDWSKAETAHEAMKRLHNVVRNRLSQTEEELERLAALRTEMRRSLDYLDKCQSCDAALPSQCTACNHEDAPMLVAQFHRKGTGEHPTV